MFNTLSGVAKFKYKIEMGNFEPKEWVILEISKEDINLHRKPFGSILPSKSRIFY
jgi:hypothetical protein